MRSAPALNTDDPSVPVGRNQCLLGGGGEHSLHQLLGAPLLGEVDAGCDEVRDLSGPVGQAGGDERQVPELAVAGDPVGLVARRDRSGGQMGEGRPAGGGPLGRQQQVHQGVAEHFGLAVAGEPLRGGVERADPALHVHGHDHQRARVECGLLNPLPQGPPPLQGPGQVEGLERGTRQQPPAAWTCLR
jgi:hypothetical protein